MRWFRWLQIIRNGNNRERTNTKTRSGHLKEQIQFLKYNQKKVKIIDTISNRYQLFVQIEIIGYKSVKNVLSYRHVN